jgi:hypothetical protein
VTDEDPLFIFEFGFEVKKYKLRMDDLYLLIYMNVCMPCSYDKLPVPVWIQIVPILAYMCIILKSWKGELQ